MSLSIPRKVFVVDDDVMQQEALKDYITRNSPHEVLTFSTGEECLKHAGEKPDVVILDYYLNAEHKDAANGMEVLQSIKKYYPDIHVVMLSSQEHYGVAMKTIQKGAEHYVVKDEKAFDKIVSILQGI